MYRSLRVIERIEKINTQSKQKKIIFKKGKREASLLLKGELL